jgi:hypothetical protein
VQHGARAQLRCRDPQGSERTTQLLPLLRAAFDSKRMGRWRSRPSPVPTGPTSLRPLGRSRLTHAYRRARALDQHPAVSRRRLLNGIDWL